MRNNGFKLGFFAPAIVMERADAARRDALHALSQAKSVTTNAAKRAQNGQPKALNSPAVVKWQRNAVEAHQNARELAHLATIVSK
jgi:hypothetical protein